MNNARPAEQRQLANPTLVYTQQGLARMVDHLRHQSILALDTESNSLYSYQPQVCLIQITTYANGGDSDPHQVADYLVDPLRLDNVDSLGWLLADSDHEVVLHAAENDILLMQRDFHFRFANLFDTQLAARILGWRGVGLAKILEKRFGLVSNKRMQRTNWGRRPLTPQQITYAQMDTHYLLALRKIQIEELQAKRRWQEAQEAFVQLTKIAYHDRTPNQRTVWQMKAARSVPVETTGVLEALWQWREGQAARQDVPPFKVLRDEVLVRIATQQPATLQALDAIDALSTYQAKRYGNALLAAVDEGLRRPLPAPPQPNQRPEDLLDRPALNRFEALRRWRTRVAHERGVTADVVFNNATLMEIARRVPQSAEELQEIAEIGPWKAKMYARDILSLVT